MTDTTSGHIALAALCVVCAFCTLTFYDFFALRTIGKKLVPYRGDVELHQLFDRTGRATVFTGGEAAFGIPTTG